MLLQEYFFRQALAENNIDEKNVRVDHKAGTCYNDGKEFLVVFPRKRIEMAQGLAAETDKDLDYFYSGTLTPRKEWVLGYQNLEGAEVKESRRGRDPSLKYSFDTEYLKGLARAKFALCPTDVYPWSYRLLEAVICGSIPILDDGDSDFFSAKFNCYKKSDSHVYREDWALENKLTFMAFHTIKYAWYKEPIYTPHEFYSMRLSANRRRIVDQRLRVDYNDDIVGSNVRIGYIHSNILNEWISVVAIDESNSIFQNCNHFISDLTPRKKERESIWQEVNTRIYSRINYTYHFVKNADETMRMRIPGTSLLIGNTFSGRNAGHELSIVLDCFDYLRCHSDI